MSSTRELELQRNLRAAMSALLRKRNLAVPHLARISRIPKCELLEFWSLAGSIGDVPRAFYQRLLMIGGPEGRFWDPLTRRLLITLKDFESFR